MRAGERQALIRVMKRGSGTNEHNEAVPDWVLHADMWARFYPLRGYEREAARERQAVSMYRCTVDYLDGQEITAEMKVVYDGLEFNIVTVQHDFNTRQTTDLMLGESPRGA